jgi:3'-5' exoribonuclease
MKVTKINQFKVGKQIQGFFLCCEKHVRTTRSGELYLDLILQDNSGRISGKLWEYTDKYMDAFNRGDPVAVKGIPSSYQNDTQLTISHINYADEKRYSKYGFDPNQLVPSIKESVKGLQDALLIVVDSILDSNLKNLVSNIIDKYWQQISIIPASTGFHHSIKGGYLKHMVSCGKIAVSLSDHYDNLSGDLVIAGSLLHDIGKVRSIGDGLDPEKTTEGRLEGHIIMGRDIILEESLQFPKLDGTIKQKLLHIILSHQGNPEKGSAVTPRFPEALLVHFIDNMDGKLNLMQDAIDNLSDIEEWSDRKNYFRTELWNRR